MKKTIFILLSVLLIQSCSNYEPDSTCDDASIEISESDLEDIYTTVELYENSFIEVVLVRNLLAA